MDLRTHTVGAWLLHSGEPAIRLMTRRGILGQQADEGQMRARRWPGPR
jgi:hypothetical protein